MEKITSAGNPGFEKSNEVLGGQMEERKKSESRLLDGMNYNRMLFDKSVIGLALCRMDGGLVDVNPAYATIIGRSVEETLTLNYWEITPQDYAQQEQAQLESLRTTGSYGPYEKEYIHKDGHRIPVRLQGQIIEQQGEKLIWSSVEDITARVQNEALVNGEKRVLEMMAQGRPLDETLLSLVNLIEAQAPGIYCSVLLLDPDGVHLRHGAAPSLPRDFTLAIDGEAIGPQAGSCGTAAFRRESVFVEDIATDSLWVDYRELALRHGLRACWSTPIFDSQRRVLGTFAIYYLQPGLPTTQHLRLIDITTHVASIGISRRRSEEETKTIYEELIAINRIIAAITGVASIHEVLEKVLDEALSITGLEGGTICMVTPQDTLQLAAHRATSEATILDLTANEIKVGDCLCGECARDHKTLILQDREAVLKFATREATRGEEIRFHAAFPLIFGGKCLGVLCLFTRTDKKPKERRLKLLETITLQIALAVQNAGLFEETLRNAAVLEERVKERTAELEKKMAEIERLNRLFVGRELRMKELKEKIKELESGIRT